MSHQRLIRVALVCLVLLTVAISLTISLIKPVPPSGLPAIRLTSDAESLPDFSAYPAGPERKQMFADYLAPLVQQTNQHVLNVRQAALGLIAREEPLSLPERRWLLRLCEIYRVNAPCQPSEQLQQELERRINAVPVALALAQGAKESGWGTSRFAQQGNNIFGHWCFQQGCGLVPLNRQAGADHEVAVFDAPLLAVAAYVRNINSHKAYRQVRMQRAQHGLDAHVMVQGLSKYSERGQVYVEEVSFMLKQNQSWLELEPIIPEP
nr:glucosaminidase domain-containing protein [Neiella litorisoli]